MPTPPRTAAVRSVQLEAMDDVDAPVKVELCDGVIIAVKPPRRWRISALSAISNGDFEKWAEGALASQSDIDLFFETDPEIADIEQFMQRLNEAGTEGKSKTSSPSSPRSRRTAKR